MLSILEPGVAKPNFTPLSYTRLNSTYLQHMPRKCSDCASFIYLFIKHFFKQFMKILKNIFKQKVPPMRLSCKPLKTFGFTLETVHYFTFKKTFQDCSINCFDRTVNTQRVTSDITGQTNQTQQDEQTYENLIFEEILL